MKQAKKMKSYKRRIQNVTGKVKLEDDVIDDHTCIAASTRARVGDLILSRSNSRSKSRAKSRANNNHSNSGRAKSDAKNGIELGLPPVYVVTRKIVTKIEQKEVVRKAGQKRPQKYK